MLPDVVFWEERFDGGRVANGKQKTVYWKFSQISSSDLIKNVYKPDYTI
jgi:hypothetical protein